MKPDLKGLKKLHRKKKWKNGWMECCIENSLYSSPDGILYLWDSPVFARFDESRCDYNPKTDKNFKCGYSCYYNEEYFYDSSDDVGPGGLTTAEEMEMARSWNLPARRGTGAIRGRRDCRFRPR